MLRIMSYIAEFIELPTSGREIKDDLVQFFFHIEKEKAEAHRANCLATCQ